MLKKHHLFTIPVQVLPPLAIIFGCVDCRLTQARKKLREDKLGLDHGEYFSILTKGSLNNLLSAEEAKQKEAIDTLLLGLEKGAHKVILEEHTQCADDAAIHGFVPVNGLPDPAEEEFKLQKLEAAKTLIEQIARRNNLKVDIESYLYDIHEEKVSVYKILSERASAGAA
jgi:hypothetical protein